MRWKEEAAGRWNEGDVALHQEFHIHDCCVRQVVRSVACADGFECEMATGARECGPNSDDSTIGIHIKVT